MIDGGSFIDVSTPLRDESPGYHHVVTRGNNKRTIYLDDRDRQFFCLAVTRIAKKYDWTVLAYCLMDNHYHLLISIGEKGLSGGMCELNSGYAQMFNAWHGRVNHLFGKRYWNRRIKTDASLWNTVRYISRTRAGPAGANRSTGIGGRATQRRSVWPSRTSSWQGMRSCDSSTTSRPERS